MRFILYAFLVCMLGISACLEQAVALSDVPDAALKVPALVHEDSVSTFVPSTSSGLKGLAVNIIYPEKPRYTDGAPVVVVAAGGSQADGLSFTMHAAQQGFLEVRLAFPGGGKKNFSSGGIYDYRGPQSQLALKDVILFAAGKIADTQGRHISELVPVKVSSTNLGIVGWSNGGNVAMMTLAKYADELSSVVNWIVFYESPIGPMFFPPNLGSTTDLLLNKHYKQGSCATGECKVDWTGLKYEQSAMRNRGEHHKLGEPEVPGVLYFDENKNGRWDEPTEFALNFGLDVGLEKQIYPPDPLRALERMDVFVSWVEPEEDEDDAKEKKPAKKPKAKGGKGGKGAGKDDKDKPKVKRVVNWPFTIASVPVSEAYFQERDGSSCYGAITTKYPDLLITVFATQIDHLQTQPDHPHIAMQYNAWIANKAHWVRLNPDPVYPATIANMHTGNFTYNKPNSSIDSSTIASFLEVEGSTKDYVMMEASIAELADRRRTKNLKGPLVTPLTPYFNSANPAPPVPAQPAPAAK